MKREREKQILLILTRESGISHNKIRNMKKIANHCSRVLNNFVSVYVCGAQQQHDVNNSNK